VRKTRDPLDHLRQLMDQAGVSADTIKTIDEEVKAIVLEAVDFAQKSPEPDPSELYTDVYLEA
jgi:pyruvate dehydrogenase E1 component alpha subunit